MDNQRGITVSSSIGTIPEEILNERLLKTIKFSQAQAGGRRGGSTTDHIFILKSLITIAIKRGAELIVTFFDIKKANDRASMDDMLYVAHEEGHTGKIWRLTKTQNENLTAKIKTKAGLTREIKREKGGKQGGKLMVPLFSKLMDMLPQKLSRDSSLGIIVNDLKLNCLLYVDDALTLAIGYPQQELTLKATHDFAIERQLEWGESKCKVMEAGCHIEKRDTWELGKGTIEKCKNYKYLGEIISRDGKESDNMEERVKKVKCTVTAIMTCSKSEIMKKIETKVLMKLHETVTLPTFLSNSETWVLSNKERKDADKTEISAWKHMLGLPATTPNPAVIFATGSLYASLRIDIRQLIYLHKLLTKEQGHWAHEMLTILKENDIGWAKRIRELLDSWELEKDWSVIARKNKNEWKKEVEHAAENVNIKMLRSECHSKERGNMKTKTKTQSIIPKLDTPGYTRKPLEILNYGSTLVTRALIMGRYGMLQCRANFSNGYATRNCEKCETVDNEAHRINYCILHRNINLYDSDEKMDFNMIYSDKLEDAMKVLKIILRMWDLGYGKNVMRND